MDPITKIKDLILNPIITLLFALAIVYFLYGLFKFVQNPENATIQEEGKKGMLWGVIGIFLMLAVYGIIDIITRTTATFTQ